MTDQLYHSGPDGVGVQDFVEDAEWICISPGNESLGSISITACYTSLVSSILPINASRRIGQYVEPSLKWNAFTGAYDAAAVRNQLGTVANTSIYPDRGTFALEATSW
jgi:hypothetical protein